MPRKVENFIDIAAHLAKRPDRKMDSLQLFIRANEVTKTIEDAYRRGNALFQLLKALNEAMKHGRGLVVVQHAWLQAKTWDEDFSLLQIANPFIVLNPELGTAFFESFA